MLHQKLPVTFILLLLALLSLPLLATQPPTLEQLAKYKKDGTLKQRLLDAKALNNHKFSPTLIRNFKHRHKLLTKEQSYSTLSTDPLSGGFQSTGSPKMLVLLIEFADYPHSEINSKEHIESKIFGDGLADDKPYDSQRNFYLRSSYNKLDIQGNVLDWYQTSYNRPQYIGDPFQIKRNIIKDALNHHNSLGHDFSQYDNDNDGAIDYLAVIWTGPVGEWATLWWGAFSGFYDDSYTIDGKTISTISWQALSNSQPEQAFHPKTLIHETGHALGLPDYYDYDDSIGPRGGVGRLDQMGGEHDHNSFSKYILGWLTPTVVSGSQSNIELLPYGENASALLINAGATASTKWNEFFLAEFRTPINNDSNLATQGMVLWHVDATIDQHGQFENDNSYTDDKLIRLIQADGLEEIETFAANADIDDFYQSGSKFTPNSWPQSKLNNNTHSGVAITQVDIQETNLSISAEVHSSALSTQVTNLQHRSIIKPQHQVNVSLADAQELAKVDVYSADNLLYTSNSVPFTLQLTNELLNNGSHKLRFVTTNNQGVSTSEFRDIVYLNTSPSSLIVSFDGIEDKTLIQQLTDANLNPIYTDYLVPLSTDNFNLVQLNYGSTYGPWRGVSPDQTAYFVARSALTSELDQISNFIQQGGNLIIEGENVLRQTKQLQDLTGVDVTNSYVKAATATTVDTPKQVTVAMPNEERPVRLDLYTAQTDESLTELLTATGIYLDYDAGQWLYIDGPCSVAKTAKNTTAKVVVSSCLSRYFDQYPKSIIYNRYLEHFGFNNQLYTNTAPSISTELQVTVDERTNVILEATLNDVDEDELAVTWRQTSGDPVTLQGVNTNQLSFTAPEVTETQTFVFEIEVDDNKDTATETITVNVLHVNQLPEITLAESIDVVENNLVTLSASISDADDDQLTFTWHQTAGPVVSLLNSNTLTPSFTAPELKQSQVASFELSVSDNEATVTKTINVHIEHINKVPVVSIADDFSVKEGEQAQLLASIIDHDGDYIVFDWAQTSGPEIELTNSHTLTPSFVAPEVHQDQLITFELIASDRHATVTSRVTVLVLQVNKAPTIELTRDFEVNESEQAQLMAAISDEDGDSLTYSWQQISGPSVELENTDSLTPSFIAPLVKKDEKVTFKITVSDGELTRSSNISVTIINLNKPPTVWAGNNFTMQSGHTVKINATASDEDDDELTFQWQQLSGPQMTLIGADSLFLSFNTSVMSDGIELEFEITASDGFATASDRVTVTLKYHPPTTPEPPVEPEKNSTGGSMGVMWLALLLLIFRKRISIN